MNRGVDKDGKPDFKAFENYGSIYGLTLGLVAGLLVAGPHFHDWSFLTCLATICGLGILVALLGHLAIAWAYGSVAGGNLGVGGGASPSSDGGGDADAGS